MTCKAAAQWPASLDAYIENTRKEWSSPGVAIAVVKDGKVLVTKGYGVRRLGSPEKVDENTLFDVASLSKSFTAAAIATLVDEGKMRWDDPARRHLPQLEFIDPYRTANVTIRDLLAHRVGVEPGNSMMRFTNYSTAEVIRRIRFLKERDPFRTTLIYSNVGYAAAGEAAAAAAKMPFAELVRTRLVEPLGMRDSTVGVDHTLAANHASSHGMLNGVHSPIRTLKLTNIHGANAVNSTAKDMASWMLFQLGDGSWNGKRIVSAEAMNEMQSPQQIIPTTPQFRAGRHVEFFAAYGLGWQVMDFRGHRMLWHSGSADGMPVYMAILPADKLGVLVMTNSWEAGTLHGTLAGRILDVMLGVPVPAADATVTKRPAPAAPVADARIPDTKPSRPLDAYAGTYVDSVIGDLTVKHEGGKLTLEFGAGGEVGDLEHWHHDVFRVTWRDRAYVWADTLVTFGLDAAGVPRRMEFRMNRDAVEAIRR